MHTIPENRNLQGKHAVFLRDFCVYSMKVNVFDDATSEDCTKQKAAPLGPLAALNTAIDSIDLHPAFRERPYVFLLKMVNSARIIYIRC